MPARRQPRWVVNQRRGRRIRRWRRRVRNYRAAPPRRGRRVRSGRGTAAVAAVCCTLASAMVSLLMALAFATFGGSGYGGAAAYGASSAMALGLGGGIAGGQYAYANGGRAAQVIQYLLHVLGSRIRIITSPFVNAFAVGTIRYGVFGGPRIPRNFGYAWTAYGVRQSISLLYAAARRGGVALVRQGAPLALRAATAAGTVATGLVRSGIVDPLAGHVLRAAVRAVPAQWRGGRRRAGSGRRRR